MKKNTNVEEAPKVDYSDLINAAKSFKESYQHYYKTIEGTISTVVAIGFITIFAMTSLAHVTATQGLLIILLSIVAIFVAINIKSRDFKTKMSTLIDKLNKVKSIDDNTIVELIQYCDEDTVMKEFLKIQKDRIGKALESYINDKNNDADHRSKIRNICEKINLEIGSTKVEAIEAKAK